VGQQADEQEGANCERDGQEKPVCVAELLLRLLD
jgi:hypothetical protein